LEHLHATDQPDSAPEHAASCHQFVGASHLHEHQFVGESTSAVHAAALIRDLLLDPSINVDHARIISTAVLPAAAAATQRSLNVLLPAAAADPSGRVCTASWPPQLADAVEAACAHLGDPVKAAGLVLDATPGLGLALGRLYVALESEPGERWASHGDRESKARRVLGSPKAVAGRLFEMLQEVERGRRRQQQEQEQQQEQQQQQQQEQEDKQQQQQHEHEQKQEQDQQQQEQEKQQQQEQQQEQQPPLPAAAPPAPAACSGCGAVKAAGSSGVRLRLCRGCRQVRYCGEECMRRHWPEHRCACKAAQASKAS
jgi:hypothetical protein